MGELMAGRLLGSSPSLEGIGEVIKAFYCGEAKDLRVTPDGLGIQWTVHQKSGAQIRSVRVIRRKGRYRFEAV